MSAAQIPADMTAIEIREPGAPQVLRAVQRPVPVPARGEVLIRVAAAGVNRHRGPMGIRLEPPALRLTARVRAPLDG